MDKIKMCVTLDVCADVSVETLALVTLPFFFNILVISSPLNQILGFGYACFKTNGPLCSYNVLNNIVGASHELSASVQCEDFILT